MTNPPFLFGSGSGELFMITQFGIIIIAAILMGITVLAYRNNHIQRLRYVITAFGLFVIYAFINLIDAEFIDIMPDDMRFALVSSIILSILILLFIGIVKKDNTISEKNRLEKKSYENAEDLK